MLNDVLRLRDEVASLRATVVGLEQDKADREIELQAAIEHGDAIEAELVLANSQMRNEIVERVRAEAKLQRLLAAMREQTADLEMLIHTITEHSDDLDVELGLANEQLRLENERIRVAKEQAESLARAKSEFVAVVSHEVRTPMNGLLGMASLLIETQLAPEQREMVETMVTSGRLLLNILDDLLDLSKIEAGRLQIEKIDVDIVQVVEESFGLMALRAVERGLAIVHRIAPEVPARIKGDPMRLRQILVNLLGNAIKFTEKGSVALTVETESRDGAEWLVFAVADTGIGIGAEVQARLFSRYYQAGSWVSRKFGGTGLGLSICRQLLELMGGEIGVASAPGGGSEFRFRIPLGAADQRGERARPTHLPARVRLIESDPVVRQQLALRLRDWGIEVVETGPDQAGEAAGDDVLVIGARPPTEAARALAAARRPAIVLVPPGMVPPGSESDTVAVVPEPAREAAMAAAFDRLANPNSRRGRRTAVANPPPESEATRGMRVLVVEDNPVNRRVAVGMLTRQGHTVTTADDGVEALEAIRAEPPDLVLMDRHMPVMDGLEAVRAIRALPAPACNIPVVALTAAATHEEVQECLVAGMDDYILKPFTPEQLRAAIGRVADRRHGGGDPDFDPAPLALLRRDGGDAAVGAAIPRCLALAQTTQRDIAAAATMRDGIALSTAAQAMTAAAAELGLAGVQRLCATMTAAIREGRLEDAVALADQLPAVCARGRAWLRNVPLADAPGEWHHSPPAEGGKGG